MFGIPSTTKAAYDHGNLDHIRRTNERRLGEIEVILVEWEPSIKRLYAERDSILSVLARINPPADSVAAAESKMGMQSGSSNPDARTTTFNPPPSLIAPDEVRPR